VEFAGKALVQTVLSAINLVSGIMEGVVQNVACELQHVVVNCRMWLVSDVRAVLMGSYFEILWP